MKKPCVLVLVLSLLASGCSAGRPSADGDRPPAVAGAFYPADPSELGASVDGMLVGAATHTLSGRTVAVLVPHAGYVFSGRVAAEGLKAAGAEWERVVLIGPSHRHPIEKAAVYASGTYGTPLGPVPVDADFAARLLKDSSLFTDSPAAHEGEHSLEVQIPFLQRLIKRWKIVPILVNEVDPDRAEKLGAAIARAIGKSRTLIVISSDLAHYPPEKTAHLSDETFLRSLLRLDPAYSALTFQQLMGRGEPGLETVACGDAAIMVGMAAAKALGADRAEILKHATSAEAGPEGDPSRVVGYGAVIFEAGTGVPLENACSVGERRRLLEAARGSISDALASKPLIPSPLDEDVVYNLPAAVFVTLTEGGRLRGCIGTTEPRLPLLDGVQYFARAAAFEDPRFPALQPREMKGLHIEISILSAPHKVPNADAIVPGRDGIIVSQGGRSGLFLPTVWKELPDKKEFLSEVCSQKAGLAPDCWRDSSTDIRVFTSEVFEEGK